MLLGNFEMFVQLQDAMDLHDTTLYFAFCKVVEGLLGSIRVEMILWNLIENEEDVVFAQTNCL